jgi:1-acyl-sn-glycerol-3-phosphate acyltransferase
LRKVRASPVPQLPALAPHRAYGLLGSVARGWLRLNGWRVMGEFPNVPRCVAAVAPHSSNLDFVHGIAVVFSAGLRVSFIAKHTLFGGVLGPFMRWVGGMPVDRTRPNGLIEAMTEVFSRPEAVWLAITPEGTRTRVKRFKSGFYRIALSAGVPILPVAFNYRERALILLPLVIPQPDVERGVAEMEALFRIHGARRH